MRTKPLALSLAAFSAVAPGAQAADITFWYGNTGVAETAIQTQCEAFNAAQDAHTLTCIGQGGYEIGMQKAIAAFRSGEHPVLIQFFDAGTLDLMLSDAVLPVAELMPDVDWSDYIAGARGYYETSSGTLFSQPYNGSTLVFYANMDMLGEVGVTDIPETWEDVIETAQLLKDAGHACPFVTDGQPWRVLEQFAARHGAAIATKNNGYDGLDAEYAFNTGLPAQHLNNLVTWRDDGLVRLSADTTAGDYTAAFNTGECAMMENSTGAYAASRTALGDSVGMTMAPMYEGVERRNTFIGGGSLWVMKGHDDADYEAAKAFLDFVRQPEQQIEYTRTTGYMPVTTTAMDELTSSGRASEPEFATAELGVASLDQPGNENSRGIRLGFYVQFRDIFVEETQKAFNGEQSMQAALDNAKARGDALLARFAQTYQGVTLP